MMVAKKLTPEDCKTIIKLINQGHLIKDLAKQYGVHRSAIERRCKDHYRSRKIPLETRNKIITAVKKGYTKAEAAELYGMNIGTVYNLTRGIEGNRSQGNHIIRQNGIKLINRLMNDGFLISDFNVPIVRNLQRKFPIIRTARYKDKTFFYLPGREEETIESFFKEKPGRIISYKAIEEMSFLLGVKFSKKNAMTLVRKYKDKHNSYWRSRRLVQRCLDDWTEDSEFTEILESGFKLLPKL